MGDDLAGRVLSSLRAELNDRNDRTDNREWSQLFCPYRVSMARRSSLLSRRMSRSSCEVNRSSGTLLKNGHHNSNLPLFASTLNTLALPRMGCLACKWRARQDSNLRPAA